MKYTANPRHPSLAGLGALLLALFLFLVPALALARPAAAQSPFLPLLPENRTAEVVTQVGDGKLFRALRTALNSTGDEVVVHLEVQASIGEQGAGRTSAGALARHPRLLQPRHPRSAAKRFLDSAATVCGQRE